MTNYFSNKGLEISQEGEDDIIKILSNRKNPIKSGWIKTIYSNNLSDGLLNLLAERIGAMGEEGWETIKYLIDIHGVNPFLIKAAGISYQDESREFLLNLLEKNNIYRVEIYESLACWGALLPIAFIVKILQEPSKRSKLAGLELLNFKAHLITNEDILNALNYVLNDFRDEIIIKAIKILQRRDGKEIISKLKVLATSGSIISSAKAIQALGSIRSEDSKNALKYLEKKLPQGRNLQLVQKQLTYHT